MTDKIHTIDHDLDIKETNKLSVSTEDSDLDTLNTVSVRDRSNSIFEFRQLPKLKPIVDFFLIFLTIFYL